MKRDFLLGGTKLPTGGAVRGAGGAMSPPVFMLKEALFQTDSFASTKVDNESDKLVNKASGIDY